MAVYSVSFNIKYDDTYSARYDSFMEQVKKSGKWWAETTSYVVVETAESIDEFCSRIYAYSDFNASKDRYLVLDVNAKSGRYRGVNTDSDLFTLIPYVKKL